MVELFEKEIIETDNKSSKGNQLKWRKGDEWYKADYTGYEGLAEYVISHLIMKSSLSDEEFLLYDLENIKYKSNVFHGVKSKNFLKDRWQLITLERLFKNVYGRRCRDIVSQEQVKIRLDQVARSASGLSRVSRKDLLCHRHTHIESHPSMHFYSLMLLAKRTSRKKETVRIV